METKPSESNIHVERQLPLGVSGLGGWLVLIQIGLYATIIMLINSLFTYTIPSLSSEIWDPLTSVNSDLYHPLWGFTIIFAGVFNTLNLLFSIYCLINMYRKKTIFPKLMIAFYTLSLIIAIVDYVLMSQLPIANGLDDGSILKDMVRAIITCMIWIPYFLKSERVQNTFIR
ncbi:DUF2569 domain-containing protein [Paenibacillus marinisediminis]